MGVPSRHHGCFNTKSWSNLDDFQVPPILGNLHLTTKGMYKDGDSKKKHADFTIEPPLPPVRSVVISAGTLAEGRMMGHWGSI